MMVMVMEIIISMIMVIHVLLLMMMVIMVINPEGRPGDF